MHIEEIKIETNANEAAASFERLTAAINAAAAALDALSSRNADISIKVVGTLASVEIKASPESKVTVGDLAAIVRNEISSAVRLGR